MCLHKFVKLVTNSVPVRTFYIEQIFVLVRMQFHNHVDAQPVKRIERATRCVYDIKFECCKCARMRFHCANALVVLRSCAPQREDWSPGSLRDLITTTVNLNRKWVYLSSQKKLKFLKDIVESILSFSQCQNENECFLRRGNWRQSGGILQ